MSPRITSPIIQALPALLPSTVRVMEQQYLSTIRKSRKSQQHVHNSSHHPCSQHFSPLHSTPDQHPQGPTENTFLAKLVKIAESMVANRWALKHFPQVLPAQDVAFDLNLTRRKAVSPLCNAESASGEYEYEQHTLWTIVQFSGTTISPQDAGECKGHCSGAPRCWARCVL